MRIASWDYVLLLLFPCKVEDDRMYFQNFDVSSADNLVIFKRDDRVWNSAIAGHKIFNVVNVLIKSPLRKKNLNGFDRGTPVN